MALPDGNWVKAGGTFVRFALPASCACGQPWSVVFAESVCLCLGCARAMGWPNLKSEDDAGAGEKPPGPKAVLPADFVRQFNAVLAKVAAETDGTAEQ